MPRATIPPGMRRSKAQSNKGRGILVHKRVLSPQATTYSRALTLAGYNQPGTFTPYPRKGTKEYLRVKRIAAILTPLFAQDKDQVLGNAELMAHIMKIGNLSTADMRALTAVNHATTKTRYQDGVVDLYFNKKDVEMAEFINKNSLLEMNSFGKEDEPDEDEVTPNVIRNITHENFFRLKKICLKPGNLTSLPKTFSRIDDLVELNANDNQLTSLPSDFGDLTFLTKLNLSNNKLTSLPKMGRRLKILNVSGNRLTSLPENLKMLNLKELNLSFNKLTSLTSDIEGLSRLENLNLSHNNLTSLPEQMGRLKKLEILDLSYNEFISLPEEIGYINSLTYLNISHNQKLNSLPRSFKYIKIFKTLKVEDIPTQLIKWLVK